MTKAVSTIRFKAKLLQPVEDKKANWTFLVLPKVASDKLPTRSMIAVEGTINGHSFSAVLEPNGQRSHWLKVDRNMREAADADVGDLVALEIMPARKEPEPKIPADLRKALAGDPKAKALWSGLTPVARRDWVQWIASAKQPETRARRVGSTCDRLLSGKRRVCCFDRSGYYSKGLGAPKAAE